MLWKEWLLPWVALKHGMAEIFRQDQTAVRRVTIKITNKAGNHPEL